MSPAVNRLIPVIPNPIQIEFPHGIDAWVKLLCRNFVANNPEIWWQHRTDCPTELSGIESPTCSNESALIECMNSSIGARSATYLAILLSDLLHDTPNLPGYGTNPSALGKAMEIGPVILQA